MSIPPKYGRVYTRINGGVSCEAITFPLSCVLAAHTHTHTHIHGGGVYANARWRPGPGRGVHTRRGRGRRGIRYTERFAGGGGGEARGRKGGIETIYTTLAPRTKLASCVYDSTRSKRSLPASITAGY